eukprot:scaffold29873_cov84-Isochrysis_galbana.AAC.1
MGAPSSISALPTSALSARAPLIHHSACSGARRHQTRSGRHSSSRRPINLWPSRHQGWLYPITTMLMR